MLTVTVSGLQNLNRLTGLFPRLTFAVEVAMHTSAEYVVKDIQLRMRQTPKTSIGRSVPGQFPAVQTGGLMGSIHAEDISFQGFSITTQVPYAPYLEFGTRKMQARPFALKGIELNLQKIESQLLKILQEALR